MPMETSADDINDIAVYFTKGDSLQVSLEGEVISTENEARLEYIGDSFLAVKLPSGNTLMFSQRLSTKIL